LRIDHIDGLWDPEQYLELLQHLARAARGSTDPLYVVVEKILAPHERLPASWLTHGTTGYEFIASLAELFVDTGAEERFSRLYTDVTGATVSFPAAAYASKRVILEAVLANTADTLALRLTELIQRDRRWRDLARTELRLAVRETMAALRVYRTYRRLSGQLADADRIEIEEASAQAGRRNPLASAEAFDFVRDVLLGAYPPAEARAEDREALARWTLAFQQQTGAVMAKAVEDTAFYTFNRFIALNEVGGDPGRFGGAVDNFHRRNAAVRASMPHTLLATSTHDTKFSEDARARLYALSELGDDWQAWVQEWRERHRRHKTIIDGAPAPDPNEEYRLYQELLAVWPLAPAEPDDRFRDRIRAHVRKSTNEARVHSAWSQANAAWLEAVRHFVDALFADATSGGFLDTMRHRAARAAEWGMINSLAQVVLKLTCPGIPDIYQGTEGWQFTLVDPDNRRPVDWERCRALAERARDASIGELFRRWHDGAIKLRITRDLLRLRAQDPALFSAGDYRPLSVHGTFADRVVAFVRQHQGTSVAVLVPRLTVRLGFPPVGGVWRNTVAELDASRVAYRDVLTGREFGGGATAVGDLLRDLPVAVLRRSRH
jgi:(1->4)-alpha-D-glucan 1-alpha-D-glucosylmutase